MIPEKHLDRFAHTSGIADKIVAERDVVLTYCLQALVEHGFGEKLAFKGGTCLRKMVFGQDGRFSEDLDFTLRAGFDKDEVSLEILEFFRRDYYRISLDIADADWYVTEESFGGLVRYSHAYSAGAFKLDISFRETPTLEVVPLEQLELSFFPQLEFALLPVPTLAPVEIIAEKIRAAHQRSKVRDIHDLATCTRRCNYDPNLLRPLVVLKLWQSKDPFDPENFFEKIGAADYDWDDLNRLLRKKSIPSPDELLRAVRDGFSGLRALTDLEKRLIENAKQGYNLALANELRTQVQTLANQA